LVDNNLWNKNVEKNFFTKSLEVLSPEKLFYITTEGKYYAYWPKNYKGNKTTLQSRNTFIGAYTEKWSQELLEKIAKKLDAHAIKGAICNELELTRMSPCDVVISKTNSVFQKPEDIMALFEIKMSIVWNWELVKQNSGHSLRCIGDYNTHQGNPGLLRSDSMLKAIGKSISVRIASLKSAKIPIIILGNTPVTKSYYSKIDNLRKYGIIQGFWSLNPIPLDNNNNIKSTDGKGFLRFDSLSELENSIFKLIKEERMFFAGMKTKTELGRSIEIANKEKEYKKKAEKLLGLLKEVN
jgi:mRNA-degrading endonuclease HigB of HigAB toxin-antitoxin module